MSWQLSTIHLKQIILEPGTSAQKLKILVVQSNLAAQIGLSTQQPATGQAPSSATPVFTSEAEQKIAQAAVTVMKKYENLPSTTHLLKPEVQRKIVEEVAASVAPVQGALPGVQDSLDISAVVAKTANLVVKQTIDIPRILIVPKGQMSTGFNSFQLDCAGINYQPVERDLLIQFLRTNEQETMAFGGSHQQELRLEDYLVRGLIDFDDISYDEHADLLYDLAGQVVKHLRSYLSEDGTKNVLVYRQKQLAAFIHAQMQGHQWEKAVDYEIVVSKGFQEIRDTAYSYGGPIYDFRNTVEDKSDINQMVFGGFKRCLYPYQKFQSDTERRLAVILDREALKWFRPVKGQFQIYYKSGVEKPEYIPDFVAETDNRIYMLEPKKRKEMADVDVLEKKKVAEQWCARASEHTASNSGKLWKYVLIPHDAIMENMSINGLVSQFGT
jgi:type III restriction enzyme